MLSITRGGLAAGLIAVTVAVGATAPAAKAAPRIANVSMPSSVPGFAEQAFWGCAPTDPVTLTFTSSSAGTMWVGVNGGYFPAFRRFAIRAGANTVDVRRIMNGGDDRWSFTFIAVGRYLDVGTVFSRSLRVNCP
jgi:hypothetical protein